jgi:hypothetical protein
VLRQGASYQQPSASTFDLKALMYVHDGWNREPVVDTGGRASQILLLLALGHTALW